MDLVAGLVTTDEAWVDLRGQAAAATRKSELRRVEDRVDAVVCAYVAWLAHHRPETLAYYGDAETGCIVTPALQPDPAAAYAAQHPELEAAGHDAVALVTQVLDEAGINYLSVTGRTKTVASFAEKAGRERDGRPLFDDPMDQITDQLGVRVITYVADDVDAVAELLSEQVVVTDDRDLGQETAREGRFGYASRHLLFGLDPAPRGASAFERLRGRTVQVQVRTVVQHAWAEFEHEVRYKGTVPEEHARELDRRFTLAAGLLELADREFSEIRHRLRGLTPDLPTVEADDRRIDPRELAGFLAAHYADAAWSRAEHYRWISGLLLARRRHHPRRAGRHAARRRRDRDRCPHGLPAAARRHPPARRRTALGARHSVRRPGRQRPPPRRPASPARPDATGRCRVMTTEVR